MDTKEIRDMMNQTLFYCKGRADYDLAKAIIVLCENNDALETRIKALESKMRTLRASKAAGRY